MYVTVGQQNKVFVGVDHSTENIMFVCYTTGVPKGSWQLDP